MSNETDKLYIEETRKVLEVFYLHSLRPIPENMPDIIVAWVSLFKACEIPPENLFPLYVETRKSAMTVEYFSIDNMIVCWNRHKQALEDKLLRESVAEYLK